LTLSCATAITRCMTCGGESAARAWFRAAAGGFVALLSGMGDEDWSRGALGVWTARDLAGHTTRALLTVEAYVHPTRSVADPSCEDAVAYYRASRAVVNPDAIAQRGRQAGQELGAHPAEAVAQIAARVLALVDSSADDALVKTPVGSMTLSGYLPTRTFELVVHGLDLAAAVGLKTPPQFEGPIRECLLTAAELAGLHEQSGAPPPARTRRRARPARFTVI
jgi:uncharacterized protein (TIGR03083 family)